MSVSPIPSPVVPTRRSLHQLAYFVLAPARYRRTGRMGLVVTPGGFGTPVLDGRVLRIEGDLLVNETRHAMATRTVTTVGDALDFFGLEFEERWFDGFGDELEPERLGAQLPVDTDACEFIADVYALGQKALEAFAERVAITEIWLWPEHFDLATEAGDEQRGRKASYGVSPGDEEHDEPYFYVSAWGEIDRANRFWNDSNFNGASLPYRDLMTLADPVGAALDFLLDGYRTLRDS